MRDYWLISDTHWRHENSLNFTNEYGDLIRGSRFSSVEDMDECMFDNWADTVKPGDYVYHLGDLVFGHDTEFISRFRKLPGSKRLIVGNHDDIKWLVNQQVFKKIQMWRMMVEYGALLTHVPVHESCLRRKGGDLINVHGHIHHNRAPSKNHRCVCVEQIDYKPINLNDVLKR